MGIMKRMRMILGKRVSYGYGLNRADYRGMLRYMAGKERTYCFCSHGRK
jgi:hypothetical protein